MSNKQTLQFGAVVLQNLPEMSGEAMQRHIDNPKRLQMILRRFLAFFKTIRVGTGLKTADDFCHALVDTGMKLDSLTRDLLNQSSFKVSGKPIEVDLLTLTVAELGFESGASYSHVCERGVELGHDLCRPEYGPQLRLQYKDQPRGEVLFLAMEAIRRSDGIFSTFVVEHNNKSLYLGTDYAHPGYFYAADDRFVFACRK